MRSTIEIKSPAEPSDREQATQRLPQNERAVFADAAERLAKILNRGGASAAIANFTGVKDCGSLTGQENFEVAIDPDGGLNLKWSYHLPEEDSAGFSYLLAVHAASFHITADGKVEHAHERFVNQEAPNDYSGNPCAARDLFEKVMRGVESYIESLDAGLRFGATWKLELN